MSENLAGYVFCVNVDAEELGWSLGDGMTYQMGPPNGTWPAIIRGIDPGVVTMEFLPRPRIGLGTAGSAPSCVSKTGRYR